MSHIKDFLYKQGSIYENSATNNNNIFDTLSKHFKIVENKDVYMLRHLSQYSLDDTIRKTRGIIIDKSTQNIICYPLDGKLSLEEFKKKTKWEDIVVEESIDGTLINMYYYNNMWNTSTRSTLDGKCFWNSKHSFKDLFMDTLSNYNLNIDNLNTSFTYSFVLCHPDTRNVTIYAKPKLYHVLTRDLKTCTEININIGIPKPKILKLDDINHIECNNYNDLIKYCSTLHFNNEGVMLYSRNRQYRTKIKGQAHLKVKSIRGNHSNIYYTILNCLRFPFNNSIQMLLKYYPEYTDIYSLIIIKLNLIKEELLNVYTEVKKLKHKDFNYDLKYRRAIRELHGQYIYLIKNYRPNVHNYKPCINGRKIQHYLYKEVDISYIVFLLSTI